MSIELITVLMFGSMLVLLALGLPLAFVTGLIGVVFTVGLFGVNGLQLIASRIYSFMGEYALVSVPIEFAGPNGRPITVVSRQSYTAY